MNKDIRQKETRTSKIVKEGFVCLIFISGVSENVASRVIFTVVIAGVIKLCALIVWDLSLWGICRG